MSYMRGKYYSYVSSEEDKEFIDIHGDKPGCGCDEHEKTPCINLPMQVFDALVMMRYAELTDEEKIRAVVYAMDYGRGNGGSGGLLDKYGAMSYWEVHKECHEESYRKGKEANAYAKKAGVEVPYPGLEGHKKHKHGRKRK